MEVGTYIGTFSFTSLIQLIWLQTGWNKKYLFIPMKQIATRDRIITFVPSCGTINENVKDNKVRQTLR